MKVGQKVKLNCVIAASGTSVSSAVDGLAGLRDAVVQILGARRPQCESVNVPTAIGKGGQGDSTAVTGKARNRAGLRSPNSLANSITVLSVRDITAGASSCPSLADNVGSQFTKSI